MGVSINKRIRIKNGFCVYKWDMLIQRICQRYIHTVTLVNTFFCPHITMYLSPHSHTLTYTSALTVTNLHVPLSKQQRISTHLSAHTAIQCSNGKVYQECGSPCVKTCKNLNLQCTDTSCVDGCFCPPGTALHEGQCIPTDQCPCTRGTQTYNNGATIQDDCNTWSVNSTNESDAVSELTSG